jgi:hypothetical protein
MKNGRVIADDGKKLSASGQIYSVAACPRDDCRTAHEKN